MAFSERLNGYIDELHCSAKELAEASGISPAAISRYRAGERVPDPDGKHLHMLAEGISELSGGQLGEQSVLAELASSISGIAVDYRTYLANLNALLETIPITNNELARALNFDPSFISRILADQRRPADINAFITGVANFLASRFAHDQVPESLSVLTGEDWSGLKEPKLAQAISTWLGTNYSPVRNPLRDLLKRLDAFDLEDFIRSANFDDQKVRNLNFHLPATKTYKNLHQMAEAELDFLKAVILSKSTEDVIMFTDMPMGAMLHNPEFPEKYIYGMCMLLKKGLHLNMIHNTDRPLEEMLVGLRTWVPLYMTGQISSYYLEGTQETFHHLLRISGTVALSGEAIRGFQSEGRYVLTKNREEVRYYRRRAERLLSKAQPLVRIITEDSPQDLNAFLDTEARTGGSLRMVMSTLPLGAIPENLLDRMLKRSGTGKGDCSAIRMLAKKQADRMDKLVTSGELRMEVPSLTPEEFAKHTPELELSNMFYTGKGIAYTLDEYNEHLEAVQKFADKHPAAQLVLDGGSPFRNIQICVCKDRFVLISKNRRPVIHFIIENADVVSAFERFATPLSD